MGGAEEMSPEIAEFLQPLASQVLYPKRLGNSDEIAHLAQCLVENDYIEIKSKASADDTPVIYANLQLSIIGMSA